MDRYRLTGGTRAPEATDPTAKRTRAALARFRASLALQRAVPARLLRHRPAEPILPGTIKATDPDTGTEYVAPISQEQWRMAVELRDRLKRGDVPAVMRPAPIRLGRREGVSTRRRSLAPAAALATRGDEAATSTPTASTDAASGDSGAGTLGGDSGDPPLRPDLEARRRRRAIPRARRRPGR
jgi:hypothetical protein